MRDTRPTTGTKRVLIVEDEPHIVESLTFLLERAGYAVAAVGDADAALEALRRSPAHALILDLMLPGRSGFEVLKAVKSDPVYGCPPVLILTAKGQPHDRRLAEDLGVDSFVTKPFSNQQVVDEVKRLTDG